MGEARGERGSRHQGARNPPTGELMDKLRSERGGKCERCGGKGEPRRWPPHPGLEFAHTAPTPLVEIPRGRGQRNRYLDIKKHPHAYLLLCRACHTAMDLKGLGTKRKGEQREAGVDEEPHVPVAGLEEAPF